MKRFIILAALSSLSFGAHAVNSADAVNVRVNPIGILVSSVSLNVDFAILPHWSLGPELKYWDPRIKSNDGNSYDVYVLGAGARANWFREGVFTEGLYVGPSLTYAQKKLKVKNTAHELKYDDASLVIGGVVGYAWFWDSLNVMLGGGANVNLGGEHIQVKNSDGSSTSVRTSVTGLTAEISLGYAF